MSKVTIFKLAKKKDPRSKDGYNVDYPTAYALPAISFVLEKHPTTGITQRRKIRYCPAEPSIYFEDQNKESKVSKRDLTFERGMLVVDEQKPNLLAYLKAINSNRSKPNRDPKFPVKFFEYNPNEIFEREMEKELEKANATSELLHLPLERQRAIANSLGIYTINKTVEKWRYELLTRVKQDEHSIRKFRELAVDPIIERIDYIGRAEALGILKFEAHKWLYAGNPILTIEITLNPHRTLAKEMIQNPSLWNNILESISLKEGKSNASIKDVVDEFMNTSAETPESLFEKAKGEKVLAYDPGKGYRLNVENGKYLGISKAEVIATLKESSDDFRTLSELLGK